MTIISLNTVFSLCGCVFLHPPHHLNLSYHPGLPGVLSLIFALAKHLCQRKKQNKKTLTSLFTVGFFLFLQTWPLESFQRRSFASFKTVIPRILLYHLLSTGGKIRNSRFKRIFSLLSGPLTRRLDLLPGLRTYYPQELCPLF